MEGVAEEQKHTRNKMYSSLLSLTWLKVGLVMGWLSYKLMPKSKYSNCL